MRSISQKGKGKESLDFEGRNSKRHADANHLAGADVTDQKLRKNMREDTRKERAE